jgi:hypothetical protein
MHDPTMEFHLGEFAEGVMQDDGNHLAAFCTSKMNEGPIGIVIVAAEFVLC